MKSSFQHNVFITFASGNFNENSQELDSIYLRMKCRLTTGQIKYKSYMSVSAIGGETYVGHSIVSIAQAFYDNYLENNCGLVVTFA